MTRNVVTISGGGGGERGTESLMQLKRAGLDITITAIATPYDTGGHSGTLRSLTKIGIGDMGRIMSVMLNEHLRKTLEQRRKNGVTLRNTMLAAFFEDYSDPQEAVQAFHTAFGIVGDRVMPASYMHADIHAMLRDGTKLVGEEAIYKADLLEAGGIQDLQIEPNPTPNPDAIAAIEKADDIIVWPGSIPCSLAPPIIVLKDALLASSARKICVANLMARPRHTDPGATVTDHVAELERYLVPHFFGVVLYNTAPFPRAVLEQSEREHRNPSYGSDERAAGRLMIGAKLINGGGFKEPDPNDPLGALRGVAHEPHLLAAALQMVLK